MRNPTGLSWEEHTAIAEQLKRFWFNLGMLPLSAGMGKVNAKIQNVLEKLFYELDELVFIDFPDHERLEKIGIYGSRSVRLAPLGYADAVGVLFALRDRLVPTNHKNVAITRIDTIIKLIDENGLRHIPALTELPPST